MSNASRKRKKNIQMKYAKSRTTTSKSINCVTNQKCLRMLMTQAVIKHDHNMMLQYDELTELELKKSSNRLIFCDS